MQSRVAAESKNDLFYLVTLPVSNGVALTQASFVFASLRSPGTMKRRCSTALWMMKCAILASCPMRPLASSEGWRHTNIWISFMNGKNRSWGRYFYHTLAFVYQLYRQQQTARPFSHLLIWTWAHELLKSHVRSEKPSHQCGLIVQPNKVFKKSKSNGSSKLVSMCRQPRIPYRLKCI